MHEIHHIKIQLPDCIAPLRKAGFSKLVDSITQAQNDQRKVENALSRDLSKTEHGANIEAAEYSIKLYNRIFRQFTQTIESIQVKHDKH